MKVYLNRRSFLLAGTGLSATFVLPKNFFGSHKKSLLVFTKSSGFEHDVVKTIDGHPSLVDNAVTALGKKYGFEVMPSKDGRIFDSKNFTISARCSFIPADISPTSAKTAIRR